MKKILYLSALLVFLMATACKDLLDVTPASDMTDDNFWKSETDLKGACNRLYNQLESNDAITATSPTGSSGWTPDQRSDEQFSSTPNSISAGSRTTPATSNDWTFPYNKIFVANNIIAKGENVPISGTLRNRWIAEAHFFRAWYYFDLVKKYGDVPLVLETFSSVYDPQLKMGRTPRETVIQQCYEDLGFAAQYLPTIAAWTSNDEFERRRVTKSSALALTVRIGLHEGTMQKYHALGDQATWKAHLKKSIDAFESLRNEGHALYSDFGNLFLPNEGSGVGNGAAEMTYTANKEIIFAKAYGPNGTTATTIHGYTRTSEGTNSLSRQMVDLFLYADGLPRDKTTLKIDNETSYNHVAGLENDGSAVEGGFGARDPRLNATIWLINDEKEDDPVQGWLATGKGVYKPFDPQRPFGYPVKKAFVGSLWTSQRDYTDRLLIRWGEMLIAYAEALYEYNDNITDAQLNETVNALRTRAGLTVPLTNAFATTHGLDIKEEIRRERTVELMTEGFRYHDLIRWKTAETELPKAILGAKFVDDEAASQRSEHAARLTDAAGTLGGQQLHDQQDIYVVELPNTRVFNPNKDYYYPIPLFEIAQSDGNIKQNPSWE